MLQSHGTEKSFEDGFIDMPASDAHRRPEMIPNESLNDSIKKLQSRNFSTSIKPEKFCWSLRTAFGAKDAYQYSLVIPIVFVQIRVAQLEVSSYVGCIILASAFRKLRRKQHCRFYQNRNEIY